MNVSTQVGTYSNEGKQILEFLEDAKNYNKYLENTLVNFIGHDKLIADFGAGSGEFAARLSKRALKVTCIEVDPDLCSLLRNRQLEVISNIKHISNFDCIYTMNVLEHIEDDLDALKGLHTALKPGGRLLIYVPAFNLIYSEIDAAVGHYRRYRIKELRQKCEEAGFTIDRVNYVDSLGFICWFLLKLKRKQSTIINLKLVKWYDRLIFPLSKCLDFFLNKMIGKNILLTAHK